ncbi:MAG: hypothetical protein WBQ48_08330 [Aeromicrobium sp.]
MDPDEPVAPWFDDVFELLGDGRSAALRRRLAASRVRLATLVAVDHPDAELTPDLFLDCVPHLVLEVNLPESAAAARSHVSVVSRLVEAVGDGGSDVSTESARLAIRSARHGVDQRAAARPDDAWAHRIPQRLLDEHRPR